MTFDSKGAARRWLSLTEADMVRGTWEDPLLAGETLNAYAERWVEERPGLSERTVLFYRGVLRRHIAPQLGAVDLRGLTPAMVRSWRQGLIDAGVGQSTVSKAYRLLRAVLNTATDDELIRRNPCRIPGASVDRTPERPVLSLDQVLDIADAIEDRYRALVLLAAFGSLRWGELMGLRRSDLDLDAGLVKVVRSVAEVGSRQVIKSPKTAAGTREVALPSAVLPELRRHVATYAEPGQHSRVFVGAKGATPYRSTFHPVWARALAAAGVSGVHLHDLRHAGNHLAALSGATTRELMGRMGHASMRAALIYQHRTRDRDRRIADSMDLLLGDRELGARSEIGHVEGTDAG